MGKLTVRKYESTKVRKYENTKIRKRRSPHRKQTKKNLLEDRSVLELHVGASVDQESAAPSVPCRRAVIIVVDRRVISLRQKKKKNVWHECNVMI